MDKALVVGAGLLLAAVQPAWADPLRPWMDVRLSAERRAELLAAQLTQDEALTLVHGVFSPMAKDRPAETPLSAGFVPGVARLGIPALVETDASLGVSNAGRQNDDATPLPSGLALAATWNPSLAYAGGAMIGKQARQKGFNVLLAGGVNLVRDPHNGRNFEYLGEDSLLAGVMAGASIKGVQSNHIVSTVKHYVLNDQETGREVLNAVIDPSALRESDMLAFELAIEAGQPGSVMCAYNKINGLYACENGLLLSTLKTDWAWKGWVMSDWGAVHSTTASALAGLDQESGEQLDKAVFFGAPLKAAVEAGDVPAARMRDMARRILWGMVSTGLMDDPVQAGGLDTAGDAKVAGQVAEQAIVLLKNAKGLLPLAAGARKIALIGGHADFGVLSGGGSAQVLPLGSRKYPAPAGSDARAAIAYHPSSPMKAILARAGGAQVRFDPGTDPASAAAAARDADVAIVFATQWTVEGQDTSLVLPDNQDAVIAAVAAANPRTVVVMETGGPVLTPWRDQVGAVLEAWYPGADGGEAIAKVLYGEADASGRLPVSFPASETQPPRPEGPGAGAGLPRGAYPIDVPKGFDLAYGEGADVGYRWYEKTAQTPAFPFGFGLSYTSFKYGRLEVEAGAAPMIRFDVTNTGTRAGTATPQVYAAAPGRTQRLIGWEKLSLKPGETRRVTITPDRRLLASFDGDAHGWRIAAGAYPIVVGGYAGDVELRGSARLNESLLKP